MPTFDIAQITENGINILLVPMHSNFGFKSVEEQSAVISELQSRVNSAGLVGSVVPIWDSGNGRLAFVAPPNGHFFLRKINLGFIAENINSEIHWD